MLSQEGQVLKLKFLILHNLIYPFLGQVCQLFQMSHLLLRVLCALYHFLLHLGCPISKGAILLILRFRLFCKPFSQVLMLLLSLLSAIGCYSIRASCIWVSLVGIWSLWFYNKCMTVLQGTILAILRPCKGFRRAFTGLGWGKTWSNMWKNVMFAKNLNIRPVSLLGCCNPCPF